MFFFAVGPMKIGKQLHEKAEHSMMTNMKCGKTCPPGIRHVNAQQPAVGSFLERWEAENVDIQRIVGYVHTPFLRNKRMNKETDWTAHKNTCTYLYIYIYVTAPLPPRSYNEYNPRLCASTHTYLRGWPPQGISLPKNRRNPWRSCWSQSRPACLLPEA